LVEVVTPRPAPAAAEIDLDEVYWRNFFEDEHTESPLNSWYDWIDEKKDEL
jgi:hypothetical protein